MAEQQTVAEETLIFDKTYECPACRQKFTSKTVKTGKSHLINRDLDNRPRYDNLDTVKYGPIVCPNCGYAAMERYLKPLTKSQIQAIRDGISAKYNRPADTGVYSYETARARAEIVLLNAMVRNAKNSERAYICLHLAWIIRGAKEAAAASGDDAKAAQLGKEEFSYLQKAVDGFINARQTEPIPMCGMDENSVDYLIAALLYETERYDEAARIVMNVVTSRSAKKQLKDRADYLKELIREKKPKADEA